MNLLAEFNTKVEKFLKNLENKKLIKLPDNLNGVTIKFPPKDQAGDIACNAALILSKVNNKSPLEIANLLKVHFLKNFSEISEVDIAKPGFINISTAFLN